MCAARAAPAPRGTATPDAPALRRRPAAAPQEKQARIESERARLEGVRVPPQHLLAAAAEAVSGQAVPAVVTLADLLRRPHVHYSLLQHHGLGAPTMDAAAAEAAAAAARQQVQHGTQPQQEAPQQDVQQQQAGPPPLTRWEQESTEVDIKYEGFIRR